jgi:hypothetical protein
MIAGVAGVLAMACAKAASSPPELVGCAKGTDCKGSRLCVGGVCTNAYTGLDAADGVDGGLPDAPDNGLLVANGEAAAETGTEAGLLTTDAHGLDAAEQEEVSDATSVSDASDAGEAPPRPCSESCMTGCCDANGKCQAGISDTICGWYGRTCSDCTSLTSYPSGYHCLPIGNPPIAEYLCGTPSITGCVDSIGNDTCRGGCCDIHGNCQMGTSDTGCGFAGRLCNDCTSTNYPSGYHCLAVSEGPNVVLHTCDAPPTGDN